MISVQLSERPATVELGFGSGLCRVSEGNRTNVKAFS